MLEPRSNKNSGVSTKMQRESGGGACARPQLQTTHRPQLQTAVLSPGLRQCHIILRSAHSWPPLLQVLLGERQTAARRQHHY